MALIKFKIANTSNLENFQMVIHSEEEGTLELEQSLENPTTYNEVSLKNKALAICLVVANPL